VARSPTRVRREGRSRHRGTIGPCAGSLIGVEDLDRRLLAFLGAHPFVLASQIERFLGIDHATVDRRLVAMEARRLARSERLQMSGVAFVRVTGAGLRAIGSRLPAPGFDLAGYRHDVGIVWLWVAAWEGVFGEPERVLSRREMQALDRAAGQAGDPDGRFSVPLVGPTTAGPLYPDVMMVFSSARVAVHLVAWPQRRLDLDGLFAGHHKRPEVADVVLCFVDDDAVGRKLRTAAEREGVAEKVRVQRVVGEGTALPRAGS